MLATTDKVDCFTANSNFIFLAVFIRGFSVDSDSGHKTLHINSPVDPSGLCKGPAGSQRVQTPTVWPSPTSQTVNSAVLSATCHC